MADISIIHNGSTDYNVKDAAGRLALAEVENKGAKNLLKNIRTTTTRKGITFTINDDGSVTANGTNDNTGASVLDINTQASLSLSNGDYILTGCPAGGSDSGYMMDITRSPGSSIKDTGSGATFTVGGDYTVTEFRIVISRNVTVDNLKFYPMICTAAEWAVSQKFVPYCPTNRELYEEKIDHDLPVVLGSILDYADTFAPGIYFARQSSSTGSGKPVNNRRYVYNIYVYSSAAATIMAIEGEDPGNPRIFLTNKISGTWSSWYKFEGTQVT